MRRALLALALVAVCLSGARAQNLTFGSYFGGSGRDLAADVVIGADGKVYVGGVSASADFPSSVGAFQRGLVGLNDGFVARIDADTGAVEWATLLGGDDSNFINPEQVTALGVDASGNVYVAGFSDAGDFPTTTGALQEDKAGQTDGFVAKFDAAGARVWATYLGGTGDERITDLAVAPNGDVVVTGRTTSVDADPTPFPTTAGALDETSNSGFPFNDGFVTRIAASGAGLVYSTYLGGTRRDEPAVLALGDDGSVYVAGLTSSSDFPVTTGAFDETFNGPTQTQYDAFVAKLDPAGAAMTWASYLGGAGEVDATALDVDGAGVVTVAGCTTAGDLPAAGTPPQPRHGGGAHDGYVARFSADGSGLSWLTYLGGSGDDLPRALVVQAASGLTTVVGSTDSGDFPIPAQTWDGSPDGGGEAFLVRIGVLGDKWVFGTYYDGTGADTFSGVAVDRFGAAVAVGQTDSGDVETTLNGEGAGAGADDAVIVRLDVPPFRNAGFAKAGTGGLVPVFYGGGSLEALTPGVLTLEDARPNALCILFGGLASNPAPWEGGVLVPIPIAFEFYLITFPNGGLVLPFAEWPAGLPSGFELYFQYAFDDPGALFGVSSSNALQLTTP